MEKTVLFEHRYLFMEKLLLDYKKHDNWKQCYLFMEKMSSDHKTLITISNCSCKHRYWKEFRLFTTPLLLETLLLLHINAAICS